MPDKPYAILLFGPTAVGKTAITESLFALPGGFFAGSPAAEIISADSVQVYRGLDIGSAKPPPEVRQRIPHHLIDILDPREQFTAGAFAKAAESLIREICGRKRLPLVSGGAAFYFRNLIYGLPPTPPADISVRAALEKECANRGLAGMYARLQSGDPAGAEKISPKDRYRILRALEVMASAGRPLSEMRPPSAPRTDIDFLVIGLERERQELYRRIDKRVDAMFAAGLTAEIKGLIKQGFRETDPGMRGIGYREFFSGAAGGCTRLKDIAENIKRNSRRYAKRQLTFFRSLPDVKWLSPSSENELRGIVTAFLKDRS